MNRILLPIAWFYRIFLEFRHKLYDWNVLHSETFDLPVISVGNLSLGGTGKSPHTDYLINLLKPEFRTAVISRGYGRKTRGFQMAEVSSSSEDIGDEPMMYFDNHPDVCIVADADRNEAIHRLMKTGEAPQVYLLDDAFQHRSTSAGLNLLLTEYEKPYCNDFLLPAGTLRDVKSASRRAQIVIVTKCPYNLPEDAAEQLRQKLHLNNHQDLFFSSVFYKPLKPLNKAAKQQQNLPKGNGSQAVCFTGIAKPEPLVLHLRELGYDLTEIRFPDHHPYQEKDIRRILQHYHDLPSNNKIIITTEKDYARLKNSPYLCQFESVPLFAAPIGIHFHEEEKFNETIASYVRKNAHHS